MTEALNFIKTLELLAPHFPGTIVVTDANLNAPGPSILYASDSFEGMTGYTPEEAIGRNPRFLQGERTNKHQLKKFIRSLSNGQKSRTTIVNYRKDGKRYLCDITAWPVLDDDGQPAYFLAIEREVNKGPGRNKSSKAEDNWWEILKG